AYAGLGVVGAAGLQVTEQRSFGTTTYTLRYAGTLAGIDFEQLEWAENRLTSGLVPAPDSTVAVRIATVQDGGFESQGTSLQTITVDATGGTFTLSFELIDAIGEKFIVTSAPIDHNASALDLYKILSPILNPNGSTIDIEPEFDRVTRNNALPFTDNFAVSKHGNVFHITFQGAHRNLQIHAIDTTLLEGAARVVELDFGAADDQVAPGTTWTVTLDVNVAGPFGDPLVIAVMAGANATVASMLQTLADKIVVLGRPQFGASVEGGRLLIENIAGNGFEATVAGAAPAISPALARIADRVEGVNYYGIDTLHILLGSGNNVFNVQGTTANTFLALGAGDDRLYISSTAAFDLNSDSEFLRGHLHDVLGALHIDAGEGRHKLMISAEASTIGAGSQETPVLVTDSEDRARLERDIMLPTGYEIYIVGLAQGTISYRADAVDGNFADGIWMWSGFGDDHFDIDGTFYRDETLGGLRSTTSLNTGLGDDHLLVELHQGEDGFFVLNTQGPYQDYLGQPDLGGAWITDDDTVFAGGSSLPLIVFGGQGDDWIITGSGNDIVFGDRGRVEFWQWVDGQPVMVASFGHGGGREAFEIDKLPTNMPATDALRDFTDGLVRLPGAIYVVDPTIGGADEITTNDGNDIIIGGTAGDWIRAGAGNDLVFGDFGEVIARVDQYIDANLLPLKLHFADYPFDYTSTFVHNEFGGGDDVIFGEDGDDILIGGQGGDWIYGGNGDDNIIGGHNVAGGHD
ncbi:MAG: calcium-binding protein, partial [Wenzhouxiangella sp.]